MEEFWYPGRIVELSPEECFEQLVSAPVGRFAYCDDHGPTVVPVNHRVDGDCVSFRTSPHSHLADHLRRGAGGPVRAAYQADAFDEYTRSGWSVLVRGVAEVIEYDELPDVDDRPAPWVDGIRTLYVRIRASSITGRRLIPT